MDDFYLLFSSGGELAGLGPLSDAEEGASARLAQALLAPEAGGRVEIWRGAELVEVVGAPPAASMHGDFG